MTPSERDDGRDGARPTPPDAATAPADDPARLANELLESGRLHRLLVDSVRDYAIFALDTAGNVLSWNAGAERLKGYAPSEIIGRHFSRFYPPNDLASGKPARELVEALRDGRVEDEGWRLRKDGTRFWASVVIVTLRDAAGRHVGFAKVTRDLTERWRAEEALRASEERLRLLVQSVRDYAIFMLDPQGRVASWNAGAEAIKQYRADEIIGRHFSQFYPPADIDAGKPRIELEVAIRDGRFEEEGWRLKKDGSRFWANVVLTPVRGSDGTLVGFAKVTRDLTERRAAQERTLADARRLADAEAANRTRTEFLTAMSHELRTPINATMGYAQLIDIGVAGPVTDMQRQYLQRVLRTQEHLLGIISDLLNYGRIEAGQVTYALVPVSLREVVDAVVPMVLPQAEAKGLTLRDEAFDDALSACADRIKLEQILLNLLSNAVKFTPEGGRIVVGAAAAGGRVRLTVSDSGPGIPDDKREAIFEPFVQLGRTLTSGHAGTGLGLSISRNLARAMRGDVTVAVTPGGGAAFTVELPPG